MILQRLVEHYDRLATDPADPITPTGFSRERISFAVLLNADGSSPELTDVRIQQGTRFFPHMMVVPDRGGRSGTSLKPYFLWDNTGYVLGADGKGKGARTEKAFEAFRELHVQLAEEIDDDGLAAVARFLTTWSPDKAPTLALWEEAVDKNLVFRIRGQMHFVHQSPAIISAWAARSSPEDPKAVQGQSLLSGASGPIARLHPMISGVTGAQTMGATIASFNANAYESYGRTQTYNAPVTIADAFKYTTALNRLLERRDRRFSLGDATVVYWAERPTELEDIADAVWGGFAPPKPDAPPEDHARAAQVKLFLSQLRAGHASGEAIDPDDTVGFYVLGLSPNASRISVRFWEQSTVGQMKDRLAWHIRDTELVGARPEDPPLTIRRIVQATGRAEFTGGRFKGYDADAVPPMIAGAVARAVFRGGPYPAMLLGVMLNRLRADGYVSHARVATIKACLAREARLQANQEEVPVALDTSRSDPGYVTGRLFALLEKIQSDSAGGDLNATIKDRYFSAASATPGLVFPRLIRLSQHHLAKLDTGQKIYHERQLGEVMGKLQDFPSHLLMEDQGLFAIGYFHQRQDLFRSKKDKEGETE